MVCVWNQTTFHSNSFEVFWKAEITLKVTASLQVWQTIILTTLFIKLSMHRAAADTKTNLCSESPTSLEAQFQYELRLLQVL